MKTRRHHNNTGERQIRRGKTRDQVARIAERFWRWAKRADQPTAEDILTAIPKVLHEHINTAYPAHVCLVGTALPNGFAPDKKCPLTKNPGVPVTPRAFASALSASMS